MGFFARIGTGFQLGKQALRIAWNDKTLMVFPLVSGLATVAATAGIVFGIGPDDLARMSEAAEAGQLSSEVGPLPYVLALLGYFSLYFITIFFNVALVACAHISLTERDSTVGDGVKQAFAHLGSIAAWALLSGTVGLLLSSIENDRRRGAQLVRGILGAAWGALTYFVVPVLVFERVNVFTAVGRSAKTLKKVWGEGVGAQLGLGWIMFLLWLPAIAVILLVLGATALPPAVTTAVAVVGGLYMVVILLLEQTAKSILTVVLYRYAAEGQETRGFPSQDLRHVFASG